MKEKQFYFAAYQSRMNYSMFAEATIQGGLEEFPTEEQVNPEGKVFFLLILKACLSVQISHSESFQETNTQGYGSAH